MRNPLGPIRVPADEFEDLDPIVDGRGRTLRRVRHKLTGAIGTEVPQELVHIEEVTPKPLPMPTSSILFLEYRYGVED